MKIFNPPFTIDEEFNLFASGELVCKCASHAHAQSVMYALGMLRYAADKVAQAKGTPIPYEPTGLASFESDHSATDLAAPVTDLPWEALRYEHTRPGASQSGGNLFVKWQANKFWIGDWSGHVTCTTNPGVLAELVKLESTQPSIQTVRSILMAESIADRVARYNAARQRYNVETPRFNDEDILAAAAGEAPGSTPSGSPSSGGGRPRKPVTTRAQLPKDASGKVTLESLGFFKKEEK